MKSIALLFILSFLSFHLSRGTDTLKIHNYPKNSVILTLGGTGIYTSLIYEREVYQIKKLRTGFRSGIGISPFSLTFSDEVNIPVGIYGLFGKRNHHLDLNLNLANYLITQYDWRDDSEFRKLKALFIPSLGWRFQKPESGLIFKAGLSSIISFNKIRNNASPWIEIGAGWSF